MALSKLIKSAASLAACLLLLNPAGAMPVERRGPGGKQILLWPMQNTADIQNNNGGQLTSTAQQLAASGTYFEVANWDTIRPAEIPGSLAFAPTVKLPSFLSGASWDNLQASIAGGARTVQYYNEPDVNGVDASQAAADWRASMLPLRAGHGVKLVGPSVTSDPSVGTPWLAAFYGALAPDEMPDYLGVHFYTTASQPWEGEVSYAQGYFRQLHEKYGLPLMVNEISSTSRDQGQVNEFTQAMARWMDGLDWVAGYGFTGVSMQVADSFSSPQAQQLNADGSINALGKSLSGA
ncbi:glycoside hydrolase family 128 protein [Xylariaceae sp. FL0804]|nr:glycoside hydrolase family 128 protein [Xylariaceae sp. FL0804]